MADRPLVLEFGEAALLVVLGDRVDPDVNRRVHRLAADLRVARAGDARFGRPVPAYASLLVPFDPEAVDVGVVRRMVESTMGAATGGAAEAPGGAAEAPGGTVATGRGALDGDPTRAPVEIPVRYGGSDGPDLDEVAARLDRHPDEVVALHVAPLYQVFMLGFSPGFPYLGVLPAELELPRRPEPRTRVPAGSVAIAGRQTGIYPGEIPGGWHLIGRTDLRLWDPSADPPARLAPGDRVRFVPA